MSAASGPISGSSSTIRIDGEACARGGRGLTGGLGYRLIDVLTDEREGGALDLEDDGRALHGNAATREESVRVDDLKESAAPFRRGILAQRQPPGRQLVAAADAFGRSDAGGHCSGPCVRIIDGARASVKLKVSMKGRSRRLRDQSLAKLAPPRGRV